MYVSKNSFLNLTKELDLFINKYYKIALIRGVVKCCLFGGGFVGGFGFRELF